ncbi:hypothetical protein OUZ56_011601 [Daphnia magna]|uniref:Uncharacterized protein n=1 Tax=Daphnia magna TaxID=35525 RepID=A0ABQ9Z0M0_9CRUS|nr:hypothetical protein OUZ56_011601 [Daphnia magna]
MTFHVNDPERCVIRILNRWRFWIGNNNGPKQNSCPGNEWEFQEKVLKANIHSSEEGESY